MDAAEALAFARKNPHAVLATMKRDGTPQLSPVLVGVDSQDRLVVSTRETAIKTANVRATHEPGCACSMTGFLATGPSSAATLRSSACPRRWNPLWSITAPSPGSIRTA